MLEICRKKDANFIFASTSHVYGQPKKNPICEKEDTKQNSIYASTKIAGENLCELYSKTYGLNISILRFFSLYGPNSPKHNVIFNIINQYKNNSIIKMGNLKPKRDFLFIDDAIRAINLINENQKGFEIFRLFRIIEEKISLKYHQYAKRSVELMNKDDKMFKKKANEELANFK